MMRYLILSATCCMAICTATDVDNLTHETQNLQDKIASLSITITSQKSTIASQESTIESLRNIIQKRRSAPNVGETLVSQDATKFLFSQDFLDKTNAQHYCGNSVSQYKPGGVYCQKSNTGLYARAMAYTRHATFDADPNSAIHPGLKNTQRTPAYASPPCKGSESSCDVKYEWWTQMFGTCKAVKEISCGIENGGTSNVEVNCEVKLKGTSGLSEVCQPWAMSLRL